MHTQRYDTRLYSILTIAKAFHLQMYETVKLETAGEWFVCLGVSFAMKVVDSEILRSKI